MAPHVSVENQFPADLFEAMVGFVEQHPQWDQYRLMQSALAGFSISTGLFGAAGGAPLPRWAVSQTGSGNPLTQTFKQ
jgi:hypothetical protein